MPTPMRQEDGSIVWMPDDQVNHAIARGMTPQNATDLGSDLTAPEKQGQGIGGTVTAGLSSAASTATLGLSDVAAKQLFSKGDVDYMRDAREAHPIATTIGEIAGSFTPIGPGGELNSLGERIIAHGEGAGFLGRTAATAAGSAVIGAGQSAGNYLSQVALDDKPLSAEGFVGAMGKGALFGGGTGAALSIASDTLLRAKALFPEAEVTKAAAQKVDQEASSSVSQLSQDSNAMQQTAQQKLQELRLKKAQIDLGERQQTADLNVQTAQAKLEAQLARTARAKAGPQRTRKVFDTSDVEGAATDAAAPEAAPSPSAPSVPMTGGPNDLMSQLQGTKSALDSGAQLGDLSNMPRSPNIIGGIDNSPRALANSSPEVAKLQEASTQLQQAQSALDEWTAKYGGKQSSVGKFERNQATRDYADAIRPKESGYYDKVPEGEGDVRLARGRTSEFRGSEAERAAADARITAKVAPEEQVAADDAISQMFARKKPTGEDIIAGKSAEAAQSTDDAIRSALNVHHGEHRDLTPNIEQAAQVIGNAEKAHADMVDALKGMGADVPATAEAQAGAYRQAVEANADKSAASSAQAAQDVQEKLMPAIAKATGGDLRPVLGKLGKVGQALEVMHSLGMHVPAVSAIPVIGPVLGLYLKAKAVMGIIGRHGGSVERTAESVIASKATAVRNRMNAAAKQLLDTSSKAVRGAAPRAADAAGVLASSLMPSTNGKKTVDSKGTLVDHYNARMDELSRAQQPGAIQNAIAERVRTSDPQMLQAIVDQYQKGLQFLDGKAPKQNVLPSLLKDDGVWKPAKSALEEWARYKAAVDDPASVLESVAKGAAVSPEAAETLRMVYPRLYAEAQMTLLQHAEQMDKTLPYARRMTLSILFQVPVDGTMTSQHLQFLQGGSKSMPAAPAAQGPAAPPLHPALAGPVQLGTRTQTALDRRAGA